MLNTKIAIIDSGIESSHPGLGKIAGGVQIQIGENGQPVFSSKWTDCAGHGTACAGIVRKKALEAAIYSVRIFDASLTADGRVLIAAIAWCVNQGMDVVNMSLGTTDVTFKEALHEACRKAVEAGVILVAAESNDGRESYPASFPEVIGVTGGQIYEPDGFYYREGQVVECVARGDEQRVCWRDGKYLMVSGTSFAAPHITGIVARLLQKHPGSSVQDIRLLLSKNAIKEHRPPTQEHLAMPENIPSIARDDYTWIKKAALYPYCKEMHSLVRYRDLLSFEITGVADPIGKGLVGKDAGEVIDEAHAGLRICPNLKDAMARADTLILGYVDQLSRIRKRDLLREHIQLALEQGCHVFSFQEVPRHTYADLYDLADQKGLRIAFPHIAPEELGWALKNPNGLSPVDVPVLAVMGTSSQQGKFTLQLALRRRLLNEGYCVGQIGTEHHAALFGMDAAFPMGYASPLRLPLQMYAPYLDYKMRSICQAKHPDIMLVGSQSGTIPYDVTEHSTHSLPSLAFLLGVKPDACLLVVNSIDADAYIRDTIDGIRAVCKAPVLMLAMGDREKHIRAAYGRAMVTPRQMTAEEIADHLKRLEDTFQIPVTDILSESGQHRMMEVVIGYFAEDRSAA